MRTASKTWIPIGAVPPTALVNARLELHWAAQPVSAAAFNHLEPKDDDSHTNLGWSPSLGGLVGRPVTSRGRTAALRFADLTLLVLGHDGKALEVFPLRGETLDAAFDWLAGTLDRLSGGEASGPLRRRDYEMPEHAVQQGATFGGTSDDAYAEVSRWFANAHEALRVVESAETHASPVRCWPHHFDIATLITLDPGISGEAARSVGVGFSPGDGGYAEPYFYVTPWPYPENPTLPALPHGHWHTEGWTGAVLTGTDITAAGEPDEQFGTVAGFLRAAVEGARQLLG